MISNKQRMLMAMRGEVPDVIPFAPRLDLWFNANKAAATLPEKYKNVKHHFEIARSEGWALHQVNPAYQDVRKPEDNLHWALGILTYRETIFGYRFTGDIDIQIKKEQDRTQIVYHTPEGTVSTTVSFTDEMRKLGISGFHIEEAAIKKEKDYGPVGYIFENLELYPDWYDFIKLQEEVGEDGVAFTMAGRAASPMHHIQKYFIDATEFFFHYKDFNREMNRLAGRLSSYFDQMIEIISQSPAEAVYWGANFDDMITYPAYFEMDIFPWIKKAAQKLGSQNKIVSCHCDGENRMLMDLLYNSGMHVAESICPFPMTKVKIGEYYAKWCDKLTIFGGIPSNLLLSQSATNVEFDAYLDYLFESVAPGRRMIFGVADSTPPHARFDRLVRAGKRIAKEAILPIKSKGFVSNTFSDYTKKGTKKASKKKSFEYDSDYIQIQKDVLSGEHVDIGKHVVELLETGRAANEILQKGMLAAMQVIGQRFKDGTVFIPEVLMSARAMNAATETLEPYLSKKELNTGGKILIGTVAGDLHDIGKNIVATMLRGVGYEVIDIGTNISVSEFVRQAEKNQPDILGLSALLTTTMPEMEKVIKRLKVETFKKSFKVIIGGAPVNQKFADDIGADGFAADAGSSVNLVKKLLNS